MKLDKLDYFQTNLYEMSNYQSDSTGLSPGVTLWVRTETEGLPTVRYRIKLIHPQKGSAVFAIWGQARQLEGNWKVRGKDLKKIIALVASTEGNIIKHIDGEISSAGLGRVFDLIKPKIEKI